MLEQDDGNIGSCTGEKPPIERRCGQDRRSGRDQRKEVRYEASRRKNHGRRTQDKDPWKESLEFK